MAAIPGNLFSLNSALLYISGDGALISKGLNKTEALQS